MKIDAPDGAAYSVVFPCVDLGLEGSQYSGRVIEKGSIQDGETVPDWSWDETFSALNGREVKVNVRYPVQNVPIQNVDLIQSLD